MGAFSGFAALSRRIQSDFVLRTARGFYLVAACIALGVVTLAIIIALLAQASTLRLALDAPVPAVHPQQVSAMSTDEVAARLAPPTNLRFVQDPAIITAPIAADEPLGYFDADTPNGLANFPDDFDLIGGDSAPFFELDRHANGRAGLRATAAFADRINAARDALTANAVQNFSVRVVARDAYGQHSAPTNISLQLSLGPTGATPVQSAAPVPSAPANLQALAREIGLAVDPAQTEVYFDTLRAALQTPRRCGTSSDDAFFIEQYRRGFEFVRARLTAGNVDLFFRGVCDAWTSAIQRSQAQTAQEQAAADAVVARNIQQRLSLEAQKVFANVVRNIAMGVAGMALAVFLVVALFLAFLAMEGHSRALRDAVEALAKSGRGGA